MSKKWFLVRALVALVVTGLLVGLLIIGGLAIYRTGWSQGYVAGQLAAEGEDVATAPYLHYGFGYIGRPVGFAPFLFGAGLLFLLFVAVGQLFRLLAWKKVMAGRPWPPAAHWARRWHRFHGPVPHGPVPPWCWGWEKPSEEETRKAEAEPNAETGAAETES